MGRSAAALFALHAGFALDLWPFWSHSNHKPSGTKEIEWKKYYAMIAT